MFRVKSFKIVRMHQLRRIGMRTETEAETETDGKIIVFTYYIERFVTSDKK